MFFRDEFTEIARKFLEELRKKKAEKGTKALTDIFEEGFKKLQFAIVSSLSEMFKFMTGKVERVYMTNVKTKSLTVLKLSGVGNVSVVRIVSDSPNYTIRVLVDGRIELFDTFSKIQQLEQIGDETAFQDAEGRYVLILTDISFMNSIEITISADKEITFYLIYARAKYAPKSLIEDIKRKILASLGVQTS